MPVIREMIQHADISRNKKRRWKKEDIIPSEVLNIIWNNGIKLQSKPHTEGMKLEIFLDSLWNFVRPPNKEALPASSGRVSDQSAGSKGQGIKPELRNKKEITKKTYIRKKSDITRDAVHLYRDTVENELMHEWKSKVRRKRS